MKKYNLILGIVLTVMIIVASHFDHKWQTEEDNNLKIEKSHYFDQQADVLLDAYHKDYIEKDEFDTLYNKLKEYDYKDKLYAFDAESEIAAFNKPKTVIGYTIPKTVTGYTIHKVGDTVTGIDYEYED